MKRSKGVAAAKMKKRSGAKTKPTSSELSVDKNNEILERVASRKPKTARGRRILAALQPQVHEPCKECVFLRGTRCSTSVKQLLTNLSMVRKPHSLFLSRKQEALDPFRDYEPLEYLSKKNHCALFCYGSTTKQHPARLIMGRTFNDALLDMYECDVKDYVPLEHFAKKVQPVYGSKPLVVAQGAEFETSEPLKNFRNFLLDFFCTGVPNKVLVKGIDQLITLTAVTPPDGTSAHVLIRRYRVTQSLGPSMEPNVAVDEVGPSFTLVLGRHQLADRQLWKAATKQPKEVKPTKVKNVTTTSLGETLGRVHVGVQDLKTLNTRLFHKK